MAKFSKAHYVILARVFKNSVEEVNAKSSFNYLEIFEGLRQNLMYQLSADNQKFDRKRFLKESEPEVK